MIFVNKTSWKDRVPLRVKRWIAERLGLYESATHTYIISNYINTQDQPKSIADAVKPLADLLAPFAGATIDSTYVYITNGVVYMYPADEDGAGPISAS